MTGQDAVSTELEGTISDSYQDAKVPTVYRPNMDCTMLIKPGGQRDRTVVEPFQVLLKFTELDTEGARSVLRRYSDEWFSTAKRRSEGNLTARYPRRKRALVPVRWYHGTFALDCRTLRIPTARGCPPLVMRLDRDVPYPVGQVRSVTLGWAEGRLYVDVTAEVAVTTYPQGQEPDPARVAGVDLGVIHPYAVAGPDGEGLLISGRALRAENRQHLHDQKGRRWAAARYAPAQGQRGSRRWRKRRRWMRKAEARHLRRLRQAQHEAAKAVVTWAVNNRVGILAVGDPRGVLNLWSGRVHNQRVRDWRPGRLISALADKAQMAGIKVELVNERGTSSTCPSCARRVPKPAGRIFRCPHCGLGGHRDLVAAASIAARGPGGGRIPPVPDGTRVTHRRVGRHLPGAGPGRRDPRRRPSSRPSLRGTWSASARPKRHSATVELGESLAVMRGARKSAGTFPAELCTGALSSSAWLAPMYRSDPVTTASSRCTAGSALPSAGATCPTT